MLDQYLDTVKRVTENTSGDVAYDLTTIDGAHMNILHGDAVKDDYVIVTNIGNDDDVLNFEKAETISANITKLTGVSNSNLTRGIVGQDNIAYQTNNTVYFYVDGCKNADGTYTYGSGLSVGVRVGVNNAVAFEAGGTNDKDHNDRVDVFTQIMLEAYNNAANYRHTVPAVAVYGLEVDTSDTVYFYNEGSYVVNEKETSRAGGNVTLTYNMYDANGEPFSKTYEGFKSAADAKEKAREKATGFYRLGSGDLTTVATSTNEEYTDTHGTRYVVNANAAYDEFTQNLYVGGENVGGIITDNTKIVNLTNANLSSVSNIVRELERGAEIKISYCFRTAGSDNDYGVKVVYVTSWAGTLLRPVSRATAPKR